MVATADVVSRSLIEIFECVPEYAHYDDPETIRRSEDAYRIALCYLTKTWGEQLLEIAEEPPTPLTSHDLHTIDALVEKVSAVIAQLNDLDRAQTLGSGERRRDALRETDAAILKALEELSRMMHGINGPRSFSLWLRTNAAPIYRRLYRLSREIARRNQVLRARRHPWRQDSPSIGSHH
jgi:hypothetical protein